MSNSTDLATSREWRDRAEPSPEFVDGVAAWIRELKDQIKEELRAELAAVGRDRIQPSL
jgi:hypothetical protein